MKQKLFGILAVLALCLWPVTASAAGSGTPDDPWICGKDGDNVTAVLDGETLTFSGSGAMQEFGMSNGCPWHEKCVQIYHAAIDPRVTSIGAWAFSDTNLSEVDIPEGVTYIGNNAFQMTLLRTLTIPASVTEIGAIAFQSCTSLTEVTFQGETPPSISYEPFYSCGKLAAIHVPHGCVEAYQDALAKSGASLGIITAPEEHTWREDGSCACGVQAAAKVNDEYYTDLQAAFDAAADKSTVTLLKDVTVDQPITLSPATLVKVTLDGQGHTITGNGPTTIRVGGRSALTVNNVTVENTSPDGVGLYVGGELLNSGNVTINETAAIVSAGIGIQKENEYLQLYVYGSVSAPTAISIESGGRVNIAKNAEIVSTDQTDAISLTDGQLTINSVQLDGTLHKGRIVYC